MNNIPYGMVRVLATLMEPSFSFSSSQETYLQEDHSREKKAEMSQSCPWSQLNIFGLLLLLLLALDTGKSFVPDLAVWTADHEYF